jgi:hypothetical protein
MREDSKISGGDFEQHYLGLELVVEDSAQPSKTASPEELEGGTPEDGSDSLVEHKFHVQVTACVFRARSWRMLRDNFVGSKRDHRR